MKRSASILAALTFTLLAFPLFAQVNDTYVIPAAANTPGAYGSQWVTQLSIFNPQSYALKVSVTFLPSPGSGTRAIENVITVPANAVVYADNSMHEIFGASGSGAYMVATFPEDNPTVPNDMVSRAFLVTSNTVNLQPNDGTYGQTIPGVFAGLQDYQTDGISAISHGVRNIDRFGWRTNFGATNLGDTAVTLRIKVFDEYGAPVPLPPGQGGKPMTYTVPPLSQQQWGLPVQVDHGSIEFFVDDATKKAVVFPYASTLDRYTGDPMYQTPTLLASAKYLFGKTAVAQSMIGRRINIDDARAIRASADRLGEITLQSQTR